MNSPSDATIAVSSTSSFASDSNNHLVKETISNNSATTNSRINERRTIDNRNYSIEEYEKRFLESLKKLNANAPKWLLTNLKMNQSSRASRARTVNGHGHGHGHDHEDLANGAAYSPVAKGPAVAAASNKKPKYERIKMRSRMQQKRDFDQEEAEEECEDEEEVENRVMMKNAKSMGFLNSRLHSMPPRDISQTSSSDLARMKRSLSNYSYNNLLKQPLSISNNSLNNNSNWYKPKPLQLPSPNPAPSPPKHPTSSTTVVSSSSYSSSSSYFISTTG
jgi:hypothetical protein